MHDMQNMQTSFPICRICTAHFADVEGQFRSLAGRLKFEPDYSESARLLVRVDDNYRARSAIMPLSDMTRPRAWHDHDDSEPNLNSA
jgi:hypothetical protein